VDFAYEILFWAMIGGLVGARGYYLLQNHRSLSLGDVFGGSGLIWYGGLLGGVVAIGLSFAAYLLINRYLLQSAFFTQEQAAAIIAFGALIGLFGSAMSVGRHLRRV